MSGVRLWGGPWPPKSGVHGTPYKVFEGLKLIIKILT
jgi:hypothetical protein